MSNLQIKDLIKKQRVFLWEIAKRIGVSEMTLCRWLRQDELPEEKQQAILNALTEAMVERTKL